MEQKSSSTSINNFCCIRMQFKNASHHFKFYVRLANLFGVAHIRDNVRKYISIINGNDFMYIVYPKIPIDIFKFNIKWKTCHIGVRFGLQFFQKWKVFFKWMNIISFKFDLKWHHLFVCLILIMHLFSLIFSLILLLWHRFEDL